jgi:hypothetical protein
MLAGMENIREEHVVATNVCCHDVGLMKRHLGYYKCSVFWHVTSLYSCNTLCWCWQSLLTFSWNLLPHIVKPLFVITVTWYCRQSRDILHPAECPPGALQTSMWLWTSSVFTTWHCTGSSSGLFTADKYLLNNLVLWFDCWTSYNIQVLQLVLSIN